MPLLLRRTARIKELGPGITKDDLVSFLESKGLPVHRVGNGGISLVTDNEETVATVTFRDYDTLNRAIALPWQDRRFKDNSVAQIDAEFDGFTPLSDGTAVDMIAIHGLYGHAIDTWQYETTYGDCFVWLRDAFPSHFPRARILTYGYPADPEDNLSTSRLRTYAETFLEQLRLVRSSQQRRNKPLIIFAHSLGGLIVKLALVVAKQRADSRYQAILDNIRAVIFFSTPHSGGKAAALVELYARALQVSRNKFDHDLIKELQPHSDSLFDLRNDFVQLLRSYNLVVHTFFETKKMPIGDEYCLIVDEQSARLGIAVERVSGLYANHMDICRFKPGSNALSDVRLLIDELLEEICKPVVTVTTRDANRQPMPPEGLKYANLTDENQLQSNPRQYPVLVWDDYTYWALSHIDNRYGMTILAYHTDGTLVKQWERPGARYIVSIKVDNEYVEFIGQAGHSIAFPLKDLEITAAS